MRGRVPGWVAPLALYAAALAVRLVFLDTRPYGDETHHFYIARGFGAPPDNVYLQPDTRWLFWWRPMFSFLLSAGAQFGFTGFRLGYMLLVAGLAPAVWWWLRGRGVRQPFALGAGLLVVGHPVLVLWGIRAFPDELMATFYVLALALWERERLGLSSIAWVMALWSKEVALIGLLVLGAEEAWRLWRGRTGWSFPLGVRHFLLTLVLALAWMPHWYAEEIGGRSPGWTRGGDLAGILDGAFTTVWLVPAVALALLAWRARRPALHALAYLAFYGVYHLAVGGAAEAWYFVLPTVLAFAALAAAADAWAQRWWPDRAAVGRAAAGAGRRVAAATPAVLLLALVAVQCFAPAYGPVKDRVLHPWTDIRENNWAEAYEHEFARDQEFWTVVEAAGPRDWHAVLAVDLEWFYPMWPLSDRADNVAAFFTANDASPAEDWAKLVEDVATVTILREHGSPLNEALRATYADCVVERAGPYLLIRGPDCAGRAERLQQEWDARR